MITLLFLFQFVVWYFYQVRRLKAKEYVSFFMMLGRNFLFLFELSRTSQLIVTVPLCLIDISLFIYLVNYIIMSILKPFVCSLFGRFNTLISMIFAWYRVFNNLIREVNNIRRYIFGITTRCLLSWGLSVTIFWWIMIAEVNNNTISLRFIQSIEEISQPLIAGVRFLT